MKLERNKEYEWFLSDYHRVRGPGGNRLKMTWICTDNKYTIFEYPRLYDDGTCGPRLKELMIRMGIITEKAAQGKINPEEHLKLGVHLWADVVRHYIEDMNDSTVWEFVYETISPKPSSQKERISDAIRKKIMFRVSQSTSLNDLRARVGEIDPSLLPSLEQMIKNGEIDLK